MPPKRSNDEAVSPAKKAKDDEAAPAAPASWKPAGEHTMVPYMACKDAAAVSRAGPRPARAALTVCQRRLSSTRRCSAPKSCTA
jgi:hypothetical protein